MNWWLLAAAGVAELVGTVAGFGSSTILLPISLYFWDFRTALAMVAIFHIFGNLNRIGLFRKGISRELLVWFAIPSMVFSWIGAQVVDSVSQNTLETGLGVVLMGYAVWGIKKKWTLPYNPFTSVVGGAMSGFAAGVVGTGGAIRSAFLAAFGLSKEKYIASAAITAILVDAVRVPAYLSQGFLSESEARYLPYLFGVAVGGVYLGRIIVDRMGRNIFRTVVLVAIFLAGLELLVN